MNWFTGIVVFLLTWWTALFCVLPFGLQRDETGKPHHPHLKRTILVTTLVSVVIWLGIYALVESDIISFREMMSHEAL